MKKNKVLILGNGLLGSELCKQTGWDSISRKVDGFDITDPNTYHKLLKVELGVIQYCDYDIIVNCIANTDTYSKELERHWSTNYSAVKLLIDFCNKWKVKLVHISTDYIYSNSSSEASENDVPVHCNTWYGYTKLMGDGLVQLLSSDYLICRCTHKETPFRFEKAWTDQKGNFDYVDEISKLIIALIEKNKQGVYNIGTAVKSMYDLAQKTKNVGKSISPVYVPKDVTIRTKKLEDGLNPFFSVAIPTYGYDGKGREFLEFSFDLLSKQTLKNFEVVISDHSEDDTIRDLCNEWRTKLDIIYISNKIGRGMISPNINNAISYCNGKWIKILFQDDFLYDANSLQIQHDFIVEENCKSWFMTKFYHSNDGHTFYRLYSPAWNDTIWTGNNTLGCPSGLTISNNLDVKFDEKLNWLMDVDYYKMLANKYGEPMILDEITTVNRTWGERLTDTIPSEVRNKEKTLVWKKHA
jgi:dTDP-4-dehydrorhamnose reductase